MRPVLFHLYDDYLLFAYVVACLDVRKPLVVAKNDYVRLVLLHDAHEAFGRTDDYLVGYAQILQSFLPLRRRHCVAPTVVLFVSKDDNKIPELLRFLEEPYVAGMYAVELAACQDDFHNQFISSARIIKYEI